MPGIFGCICDQKNTQSHDLTPNVELMRKSMAMDFEYITEEIFSNSVLAQSAIHLHYKNLSITDNDFDLRLEGESYNWKQIANIYQIKANTFSELLLSSYKKNQLKLILNKIDGYFCGSIYDSKSEKLTLFTDRWGMRFLYYYYDGINFAWASEIKGLLSLPFVKRDIDENSISCFVDIGYLLSDNTPFKYIKLIKQASIIEYDIKGNNYQQEYYWKWSEIHQSNISYSKAVDQLAELLPLTVKRRFSPNEKIGISLSGGLDSRMIFAALQKLYPDYKGYCYTFGKPECLDVKISKLVAEKSNWTHEIFDITSENWFNPRLNKVWLTDGMMNIKHMHGSEFMLKIASNMNINLNGYAGDAITGSSFLKTNNADKTMSEKIAQTFYRNHLELANIKDDFYSINKCFPNLFANRVRRFTTMGSINEMFFVDQRKPFLDNELMEFVFSLPDTYRFGNKIYSDALLKAFPEYFCDIPWQKTGFPIGKKIPTSYKVLNFIKRVLRKLNICDLLADREYTDYSNWIKQKEVSNQLTSLLTYKDSIYSQYTTVDFYNKYLIPHLNGKANNNEYILRAATIAVYLNALKNH